MPFLQGAAGRKTGRRLAFLGLSSERGRWWEKNIFPVAARLDRPWADTYFAVKFVVLAKSSENDGQCEPTC